MHPFLSIRAFYAPSHIFFPSLGKIASVMHMKNSKELLTSLLKTTQMGQVGIRSILDMNLHPGLRRDLCSQLKEYDSIETQAHRLASQRGWELPELDPGVRMMTDMMTRIRLSFGDQDSKAAGMMIQGNTRGMIKSLEQLHQYSGQDRELQALAQKLLDCETANIRQMQPYL